MSQLERAKEALYGDTTIRDELSDEEAKKLYAWAEARITELAAKHLDDEAFDAAWEELRKLLMRINRFVGRRGNMSAEEQGEYLGKVADAASAALGVSLAFAQSAGSELANLDNAAAVEKLTRMIAPPELHAVDSAVPQAASDGQSTPPAAEAPQPADSGAKPAALPAPEQPSKPEKHHR
jgi:hypothetical protein